MGCQCSKPTDVESLSCDQSVNTDFKDHFERSINPLPRNPLSRNERSSNSLYKQAKKKGVGTKMINDKLLCDNYRLTEIVLGAGISGYVRIAVNKENNRQYAVKSLDLHDVSRKKASMLYNEVSVYLALDHPNICKLIEIYEEPGAIHLVMEYCTGGELYSNLATRTRYSEEDAADVARQMLDAINYCHKRHICHRDLKLENWVYSSNSESWLKLIDFGFSRIFNPGVPMTAMHGTVYYVSPEVMDGCYNEKCDVWSIGVIVYMLLSGIPPFNGNQDHEILAKIKKGNYSLSGPRWDAISEEAKDFVQQLMNVDHHSRISAEEALGHIWLNNKIKKNDQIDVEILKDLSKFSQANDLKRLALGMIAMSNNDDVSYNYAEEFKKYDLNKSGTIQMSDLAEIMHKHMGTPSEEVKRIFKKLDVLGDSELHYSEFLASAVMAKFVLNEHSIKKAFQNLDIDKTGYIEKSNLKAVLGDTFCGMPIEDILKQFGSNKESIDYKQFMHVLLQDENKKLK